MEAASRLVGGNGNGGGQRRCLMVTVAGGGSVERSGMCRVEAVSGGMVSIEGGRHVISGSAS